MRDSKILLGDILFSIRIVEDTVSGKSLEEFSESIPLQDIVIRRLSVIGEASKNIPKSLKDKHTEIDWRSIAGMRDFLIHEYFDIDIDVIWKTIETDVPALKNAVKEMLKENKKQAQ